LIDTRTNRERERERGRERDATWLTYLVNEAVEYIAWKQLVLLEARHTRLQLGQRLLEVLDGLAPLVTRREVVVQQVLHREMHARQQLLRLLVVSVFHLVGAAGLTRRPKANDDTHIVF